MALTRDVLEHAAGVLGSLPRGVVSGFSDDEQLTNLADVEALGRAVDALRVEAAGEVEARSGRHLGAESLSRRHGHPSGTMLVEQVTRTSRAEANRRVRVGSAIAPRQALTGEVLPPRFELVAEAVCAGSLPVDAAAAIIRHLTDASRTASVAVLQRAEARLVELATTLPCDLVAVVARRLCAALDPDGVRPREEALRERRRFFLGREVDGLTPFSGLADPIHAALLRAALAERTAPSRQPRFVDSADLAAPDGNDDRDGRDDRDDRAADTDLADTRRPEQRDFDVLFGLLTAGIRADNDAVGSLHGTATVSVVVRAEDLAQGTGAAWIDDVLTPVSTATTHEIICDGGVRLHIEGSKGEILFEGVRDRYFTPAQRRALAVRDGGCLWPQCTAPPSWCHAHHIVEWEHGGRTTVDNGALLCSFHHHLLHSSDFELRMNGGRPELLSPPWIDRERTWRPVTKSRVRREAA